MSQVEIGIVMGSVNDLPIMKEAAECLEEFGVIFEINICSAHRSPKLTREYASSAAARGIKLIIAGAGGAAHLAGVIAAETILPVIGVPIASSSLQGLDALLSTVQMPGGVPVATMALGSGGAKNAAILAVQILALSNNALSRKLLDYKASLEAEVREKSLHMPS